MLVIGQGESAILRGADVSEPQCQVSARSGPDAHERSGSSEEAIRRRVDSILGYLAEGPRRPSTHRPPPAAARPSPPTQRASSRPWRTRLPSPRASAAVARDGKTDRGRVHSRTCTRAASRALRRVVAWGIRTIMNHGRQPHQRMRPLSRGPGSSFLSVKPRPRTS